jgi:hypothetical protein
MFIVDGNTFETFDSKSIWLDGIFQKHFEGPRMVNGSQRQMGNYHQRVAWNKNNYSTDFKRKIINIELAMAI